MSDMKKRVERLERIVKPGDDFCACPDDGGRTIVFGVNYYDWLDNPDRWDEICPRCGKPKQVTVVVVQVVSHDGKPLSKEEVAARWGFDNMPEA